MTQYESQYERMTKQPIPSLILTLALPTTISMLVTNIYNMADTYFVSTVGTSATGAVGIVFGLMAILQNTIRSVESQIVMALWTNSLLAVRLH